MFRKEITTTADDFKRIVLFTEYGRKKINIILIAIFITLAVAGLILGIINIIGSQLIVALIGFGLFLICGVAALFVHLRILKLIKDGVKYGKVTLNEKRIFEYDTEAVKIHGGRKGTDVTALWHTIFAIYELDDCFIIYITYRTAFCVPKNQLSGNESYTLRTYFQKRLQERFYLKTK